MGLKSHHRNLPNDFSATLAATPSRKVGKMPNIPISGTHLVPDLPRLFKVSEICRLDVIVIASSVSFFLVHLLA